MNPEDMPPEEGVPEDDQEGNEAEILSQALEETERPPKEIDREIEGFGPPERITCDVTRFKRNTLVRARVLQLADGVCELCDEEASFTTPDGHPYLEVHHVKALSEGGYDEVANMAAICPNCHRNIHLGYDGRSLNNELAEKIADKPGRRSSAGGSIISAPGNREVSAQQRKNAIAFEPYIGPRYHDSEIKLILVGESHYGEPDHDPLEYTRTVVHGWRNRKWAVRFLTVAARVLTGQKAWELDRQTALDPVGFYNFVQVAMPSINVRPTGEQARASYDAFRELLQEHDPTHLLVTGSGFLWSNMPKSDRETTPLLLGGELFERRDYKTPSGYACAIAIAHLSRASAPEWQPAVADFKAVRA